MRHVRWLCGAILAGVAAAGCADSTPAEPPGAMDAPRSVAGAPNAAPPPAADTVAPPRAPAAAWARPSADSVAAPVSAATPAGPRRPPSAAAVLHGLAVFGALYRAEAQAVRTAHGH